jgi:methyltransferase (TIGR00027 family)
VPQKRYIDEPLIALSREIGAVVNLGAGIDTRAYRLPPLAEVPGWEVDQPANINSKQDRLRQWFGRPPEHITFVSIDFDQEALGPALASRGYTAPRQTFFIWEAATQYPTETGIKATLDFLATAPRGSRLGFSYVLKDFLDGQNLYGQERLHERYVKDNISLFGLDPRNVSDFLDPNGWARGRTPWL